MVSKHHNHLLRVFFFFEFLAFFFYWCGDEWALLHKTPMQCLNGRSHQHADGDVAPFSFTSTLILTLTPFLYPPFSIQVFSLSNQPCLYHLSVLNTHLITGSGDSQTASQAAQGVSRLKSAFHNKSDNDDAAIFVSFTMRLTGGPTRYRTIMGKLWPGSHMLPVKLFNMAYRTCKNYTNIK